MNTVVKKAVSLDERGELSFDIDGLDAVQIRGVISNLKEALLALPEDQKIEGPVKHTFANGMYMRELFIPAGTLLVGKVHTVECLNIVAAGDITVLTEKGVQRLQAGFTGVSGPGSQKVGYAHTDTLFINVFRTDETDLKLIEQELTCDEQVRGESLCLGQ